MLSFVLDTDAIEVRELARSVRKLGAEIGSTADSSAPPSFDRAHFSSMAKLGLAGMTVSEEHDGTAFPALGIAATCFELAREQLGLAVYLSVHLMVSRLIDRWANPETFSPLLSELASGEKLGAFCLTESSAGSDAAALSTRAEKKKDSYVLNGEKVYITSGGFADTYLVFARTGAAGPSGISAFVVDKDSKGMSFGRPEKKMGCHGSPITSVTFENCFVPNSNLVGEEGSGYRIALSGLNAGRVNIAACACGLASKALALACAHVSERKQFGKRLAQFQGLQFMLADMATKLEASLLLTREAAAALDRNERANARVSMAKCFATDSAMSIATDAVQLLGGAGYLADFEVEGLMRDAKMLQIVEGTNQIQRIIIARSLLGEAMEEE